MINLHITRENIIEYLSFWREMFYTKGDLDIMTEFKLKSEMTFSDYSKIDIDKKVRDEFRNFTSKISIKNNENVKLCDVILGWLIEANEKKIYQTPKTTYTRNFRAGFDAIDGSIWCGITWMKVDNKLISVFLISSIEYNEEYQRQGRFKELIDILSKNCFLTAIYIQSVQNDDLFKYLQREKWIFLKNSGAHKSFIRYLQNDKTPFCLV